MVHQGPVRIIDEKGVNPSALDKAIKEQRKYYANAGDLNSPVPNHFDHSKRNFQPK